MKLTIQPAWGTPMTMETSISASANVNMTSECLLELGPWRLSSSSSGPTWQAFKDTTWGWKLVKVDVAPLKHP